MSKLVLLFILLTPLTLPAQKEIYIPIEWQQGSLDYSLDRSAQSDNFIVFWGPLAGTDPTQAPAEIVFDPHTILTTAEELYKFYIDTIKFVPDDDNLLGQYKIIIVMLHTWTGLEGWAFGGSYDATVGAMWMHPHAALSGPTLAHEFTHTLQNYTWILNPGHGFIDSSYVGFFWETHAEFMALQKYPSVALEFDMARWLNTNQFHWSSTRHHYQAFVFLQFIKELDGITMINRMWNESNIGEHPLQTYMRLKEITQKELNTLFGQYAMRNVTWDYEIGDLLRDRVSTLESQFVAHPTIIPETVDTTKEWYKVPNHLAPQDYGYNIIRIYPKTINGCDKRWVSLHLKPQTLFPDFDEGELVYGFVAVNALGTPRYSELYDKYTEHTFEMNSDETALYLVITGVPAMHHNYAWEIGFPKIYRYPYEFRIENGWPEGYQPGFRSPPSVSGSQHINGGGFVANTAIVSSSVYVGPDAQVLDQARVLENARIEGTSIVKQNALIRDNAIVRDYAIIGENAHVFNDAIVEDHAHIFGGSEIYDSAKVSGNALLFFTKVHEHAQVFDNTFTWGANLHGDVRIGGDAEFFSECADGTYLQFEGAYNRNCDGLDDHPANEDVTQFFISPKLVNTFSIVCDTLLENKFTEVYEMICMGDSILFEGNYYSMPGNYSITLEASDGSDSIVSLWLDEYIYLDVIILPVSICEGDTVEVFEQYFSEEGTHKVYIPYGQSCLDSTTFMLSWYQLEIDTSVINYGFHAEAQGQDVIFQWYDCVTNQPITGAVQRTFSPSQDGYYKVRLTTIEGCEAYSECHYIGTTSTYDPRLNFEWSVFPNPSKNIIEISVESTPTTGFDIEITNTQGQVMYHRNYFSAPLQVQVDISHFVPGAYTVLIKGDGWSSRDGRFIKIK